tara:strand:- start:308 stop:493 length:186 start_codon:yes stop_codon:yes gene_type:complete
MNNLITALFSSKKTWIAISSIIIPICARFLNVDEIHVQEIYISLLALLGGQSLADFGKSNK